LVFGTFTRYFCGAIKNFRTTDGGENCNEQHLSDVTFKDLYFPDSLQGWMVGESGLVCHTKNTGITWNLLQNPISTALLKSVSFANQHFGWATGQGGTILKIDNSNPTIIFAKHDETVPHSYPLFQNYPNPFNPITTIKYLLPKKSSVKIIVYDLLGREISVLVDEIKSAGMQQVVFNAAQLGSGVYIYSLKIGTFCTIKK